MAVASIETTLGLWASAQRVGLPAAAAEHRLLAPRAGIAASIKGGCVAGTYGCARQLAGGCRAQLVCYGRFLANPNVTVAALLDGWGEQTAGAAAGWHVLAIQDTSEVHFRTAEERRRGLGELATATSMACWCMRCGRWMRPLAAALGWSVGGCGRAPGQ